MECLDKKVLLKNSFIAGGILAAYFLLIYLSGLNYFSFAFITFIIEASVVLSFMFITVSKIRKQTEEKKIKLKSAIFISIIVMLIALFCFQIMKLLILFVVDPEYNKICVKEVFVQTMQVIKEYPQYANNIGDPENIKNYLKLEQNLIPFAIFFINLNL